MMATVVLLAATLSMPAWMSEIPAPASRAPRIAYPAAEVLGIPSGPEITRTAGRQLAAQLEQVRSGSAIRAVRR